MLVDRPVPFQGTEEERNANRATHYMVAYEVGEREECIDCCARAFQTTLDYPCGADVPRETIDTDSPDYRPSVLEALMGVA
jgi:hypothetical protein